MTTWHLRSKRAPTGAKLLDRRKKRRSERGVLFVETQIANKKSKKERTRGGNMKIRLVAIDTANVSDNGKIIKAKILSVSENSANPHYVRRNIITKGAMIKTDAGTARVTSRPGQHGVINAVLVVKKT